MLAGKQMDAHVLAHNRFYTLDFNLAEHQAACPIRRELGPLFFMPKEAHPPARFHTASKRFGRIMIQGGKEQQPAQ